MKPSDAAIVAAENAEVLFRDVYDSEEQAAYETNRVRLMLRAAYAADTPRIVTALRAAQERAEAAFFAGLGQ